MTAQQKTSTALTTLSAAFVGGMGEEAVKPVLHDHPRLQWFNGLSTTTMEMAVGWHIEADVNPQLDEVAASLGLKHYVVQHKTTAQNGEAKQLPYWALNFGQRPVSLIVISLGLQSKRQMNKTEDRVGIAYGWETVRDSQGAIVYKPGTAEPKKQCKLQFRAFVHELVEAGFDEWLQVGITGYLTDCMLEALNDHFRTLEAYSALTEQEAGERRRAPFFGFSLPLVPGPVKMVGPQNGEKSPIYPMVARIPQQIERSFLAEHLVPSALLARIRDGLLDETLLWSMERSIEINQGKAQPEDGEVVEGVVSASVVVEEAPASLASTISPQPGPGTDGVASSEEVKWITSGYCMGNQTYINAVCQRFGVSGPEQLRKEHYRTLYSEVTNPQPAQQ